MFRSTHPLWSVALRPFYLLGALDGALAMLVWTLALSGHGSLDPASHAKAMIGGLVLAVVAGFLLTAVANWTGKALVGPSGLQALVILWLLGRAAFWLAGVWALSLGVFPAVLAALVIRRFIAAAGWRHWAIGAALVLLALAATLAHFGLLRDRSAHGWYLMLAAVAVLITVIGGRIIPGFTNNAVRGAQAIQLPWLDFATALATFLALLSWAIDARASITQPLAIAALVLQLVRFALWKPWKTRAKLLLWILPLSYLWLVAGLAMIALGLSSLAALHALAAGAMGGMMLAVMTRSSKGHTGRALEADGWDGAIYGLVHLGAFLRVAAVSGLWLPASLLLSGISWASAFGLFALRYWPVLTRPRQSA